MVFLAVVFSVLIQAQSFSRPDLSMSVPDRIVGMDGRTYVVQLKENPQSVLSEDLKALAADLASKGYPLQVVATLPSQRLALLRSTSGIFALEPSLSASHVAMAQILSVQPGVQYAEPNVVFEADVDRNTGTAVPFRKSFGAELSEPVSAMKNIVVMGSGLAKRPQALHEGAIDRESGRDFSSNSEMRLENVDRSGHSSWIASVLTGRHLHSAASPAFQVIPHAITADQRASLFRLLVAFEKALDNPTTAIVLLPWNVGFESRILRERIRQAAQKNILVVAAAGEGRLTTGIALEDDPIFPAFWREPNLLVVAATDAQAQVLPSSNYSPQAVDIAAPGIFEVWDGSLREKTVAQGSALAATFAAGAVAEFWSRRPQLSAVQVKERVTQYYQQYSSLRSISKAAGWIQSQAALIGRMAPPSPEDPINWSSLPLSFESPHGFSQPTDSDGAGVFQVQIPGAKQIALQFAWLHHYSGAMAAQGDRIEILDGEGKLLAKYAGRMDGFITRPFDSDRVIVRVTVANPNSQSLRGFSLSRVYFR